MSDFFDLKAVSSKVYSLLLGCPPTRGDDHLLVSSIWKTESHANTKEEFLQEMIEGKLSHFESIRRIRQKLQEKYPPLGGDKWEVRHHMESAICEQLTFF